MKKLTIALCALGISSMASAGSYLLEDIDVPPAYSIGAEFIYVEPTGLNFIDGKSPDWAPGLRVEASYYLNDQYDITGNFMWFKKDQNRMVAQSALTTTHQSIDDEFWDINVEFGRSVQNGALSTRYHVGVKYADIQRNVGGTVTRSSTVTTNVSSRHKTTAFGPRIGVDAEYEIMESGFSLVGNVAASALLANSRFNTVGSIRPSPEASLLSGRTNNVIPALEASLGGKYVFDTPEWGGNLALEGGYQWVSYIESIEAPDTVFIGSTPINTSDQRNFGFSGIYAGLKWTGDQLV